MASEVLDRTIAPGGYIGTNAPPLIEKESVFNEGRTSISAGPTIYEKDQKLGTTIEINEDASETSADEVDGFAKDPFIPFTDMPEEKRNIITIRALVVGCICGALVNASNIYLGLKSGWTFSANIFGSIVGFAVCKAFAKYFAHVPILGGDFGPKENAILQTAAMGSGAMSNVFVSAFPALYQLKLLSPTPAEDYWRIVALTAVGGAFGLFFATPLRKFFIIHVARELRLIFPSASATALTIRGMHQAGAGGQVAKLKMKALSAAFAGAMLLRVVSQYAIGILWDWHIFTWFFIWGNHHNLAMHVENWGWYIEWTPAFIGAGMLIGLNVAFSFFSGSVIAWGIVGPTLVKYGVAFGGQASEDPEWSQYINYFSLSERYSTKTHPSPRYWMLWPGVLAMIVVSFVELGCQYKVFYYGGKAIARGAATGLNELLEKRGKGSPRLARMGAKDAANDVADPTPEKDQIKTWMWLPGTVLVVILTCVVTAKLFSMAVGESILVLVLAFLFSLLALQCTGATDITPLTAASKASQIVLGGVTKAQGWAIMDAQRLNLIGGSLASMGADQSSSLVQDFRTGFLLGTPPKLQYFAQCIATIVAIFMAPAMFVLFAKAYPCILDKDAEKCAFAIPSVSAWRAVAVAMTDPTFPVPTSSGIFAICWSVLGAIMVLIRHNLLIGERAWMRAYWPNMMAVSLAFVLPQTVYGTANVIGALIAFTWMKYRPKSFEIYGYAVAAGFISGEGIGGVINAIFQIAGISGDLYGSSIACPGDSC